MQSNLKVFKSFTLLLAFIGVAFISGCNKAQMDNVAQDSKSTAVPVAMLSSNKAPNPFSVVNIQKALADLGRTDPLESDRIYHYYTFDPNNVTGDMLAIIEADENHHILNFPFADGDAYTDAYAANFDPNNMAYTSGNLYIVFKTGGNLDNLFQNNGQLGATKLDELYLPKEEDEELQLQTIANSKNVTVEAFRISWPCLFKRPRGRVTYLDSELNTNRGVPNIKVWALAFGIPRTTQTDGNGNYQIPWLFSVGTVIGTHAKSSRVNIKPLDVTGNVLSAIVQIAANFIIGSVHIDSWKNACQMKNDINIDFNQNDQRRYWAQLLDAVRLHDNFTAQDGINNAPSSLVWYAAWDNHRGDVLSAPMLSHLSTSTLPSPNNIANILSLVFNTNLANNAPNFLNQLTGLLPSIITDESPTSITENHYSERLMQTAFHELAHASLFTQVGEIFWSRVITNVVTVWAGSSCGGYGCGSEIFASDTKINEAWAEYLSKEHHRRIHPDGESETGQNSWTGYPAALEDDRTFVNLWIPTGIFWDFRDGNNPSEPTDDVNGFTISQMYFTFSPNVHGICDYGSALSDNYPTMLTLTQFNSILTLNDGSNCD